VAGGDRIFIRTRFFQRGVGNMNRFRMSIALKGMFLIPFLCLSISAQTQTSPEEGASKTAEGVVSEIYKLVTFEAGKTPDWEKVKSLFISNAVIVLRTSRSGTTVFSVEGFVDDFVNFIERANAKQTGFAERIIRTKPLVFGDMANILVLYEARIPGSTRPPQQGVDSFLLIKKEGRWRIVAITNEIPTPDNPIPAELRD
jgi:hypothetical protein